MYIQTWKYCARVRNVFSGKLYRFIQGLCRRFTGHEWSKTEWGYGGGNTADVWCRWCNKFETLPYEEVAKAHPQMRKAIWNFTGELPPLHENLLDKSEKTC